jgi:oxygen-independent coproporphyrinogen III oxidase
MSAKLLYIHIPFCVKKCLFCSFAVSIGQAHRMDEYIDALQCEAMRYQGHQLRTVYLGGGTPSFLSAAQLERLVAMLRKCFVVTDGCEWSIETNPEDITPQKARHLKELGFDRVSLGIQTFNDAFLKFLGRAHDSARAKEAFATLREHFSNINVDLMFGFPKQTRDELDADLMQALELKSEHLSIYTLTIEPNSRFFVKQMKLDDEEKIADDYVHVCHALEHGGLKQYEVSNFARKGFESKHNQGYWGNIDYIGLGMGAHSLLDHRRFWNHATLSQYLAGPDKAMAGEEVLSAEQRLLEQLVFGLRRSVGVSITQLEKGCGVKLPADRKELLAHWVKDGFLQQQGESVCTTMRGRLVLDELSSRLI